VVAVVAGADLAVDARAKGLAVLVLRVVKRDSEHKRKRRGPLEDRAFFCSGIEGVY
jgi:hypothetical protein